MIKEKIVVLSSTVGLGTYIPALLLKQKIQSNYDILIEIVFFEDLFYNDLLSKIFISKTLFHENIRFAKKSLHNTKNMKTSIDPNKKDILLKKWASERITRFIVFSGFWMEIVLDYISNDKCNNYYIDCIHMDATISNSWKNNEGFNNNFNHVWLFSNSDKKVNYYLGLNKTKKTTDNYKSLLIHGGGWGIGNLKEKCEELINNNIMCKYICYCQKDFLPKNELLIQYYLPEEWSPLNCTNRDYPPLYQLREHNKLELISNGNSHATQNVICGVNAIVSKPGGATLLDSIEYSTPIVFLEPISEYECENQELWITLGFGITYSEWKKSLYDFGILAKMKTNIEVYKKNLKKVDNSLCSLKQK